MKRQQDEGDVQNESDDSDNTASEMCNDVGDVDDNGDIEMSNDVSDDGHNSALEIGNDVSDNAAPGISDDRRLQLESYLKAHKIVGEQGVERLLELQGTDPKNAALYQDMIWLLSTPGNEGETSAPEEEMVVVKPEFDAETYAGGEYDDAEAEPYRKRRRLSDDGPREMISPPNTATPGRQTVTHLSQLPDDGKPWYDGCEY